LTEWNPDLIVVAAYGRILPRAILELPPLGCINVHASLLPAYRGAAPIQWAIADGCTETGVTVMQMDEGLDTGNILTQQIVPISETETADSLHDKLSTAGTELLLKTLPGIAAGTIHSTPQNSAQATDAPILSRSDGHIDFTWDGQRIANRVRGFHPWPGTLCSWREKTLKFHPFVVPLPGPQSSLPGTILEVSKQGLTIACGDGAVLVTEVQLEGKRRMDAFSFAMGARLKPGELFKQVHR
jgi:methionyl-tRNA formyltransferase